MKSIQIIELHGRPVAATLGHQAIIADHVTGQDRAIITAMALYALEIQTGQRPGPYSDPDAERYAHDAIAQRQPGPRRRHRGAHRHDASRT